MINFKKEVVNILEGLDIGLERKEIEKNIETPPNYEMGDYAFPCFILSKKFKKAPHMISEELSKKISENKNFEKIVNQGPYINFYVDKDKLTETVIKEVYEKNNNFGSSDLGQGKTVLVEFSSPNIAKPFHIGHIRTTVIGNAIYNIYKFLGFNAKALNHLGDYGTQFGMLISAYRKWGDKEVIEKNPIDELLKLYVRFNKEAKEDENLKDEARYWFKKLEEKDDYAVELWTWIREISLKEFKKVYKMLNIDFDSYKGEAYYSDQMDEVTQELSDKGLLEESDGAYIVDLEKYNMPPALIRKSDGTSLYITRDIAAAIYRKENYNFYKNIYVVASEQNLHFRQWFKVVELMGHDWAEDCIHVPFGMVSLEDGKLSTREGRVIYLEDVLKEATSKTLKIIEDRNPDLENKEKVAEQVGIGAVIFQELFNNRIKDYTFSWKETLSFEGETGPYVQYTHARACSLLSKGDFNKENEIDYSLISEEEEIDLIRSIYNFPQTIVDAMNKNEPSYVTRQLVDIAKLFNRFYTQVRILDQDEKVKNFRLSLTYVTKVVLETGLNLLGIQAPEKM